MGVFPNNENRSMDDMVNDMREDFFEQMSEIIDSQIHASIRSMVKEDGNEMALAVLDLLAEYGIYGTKALEFTNKLMVINKKFDGKQESNL